MRGLWKAAALLSSLSASAAIVPRSLPIKYEEALDFVTKYIGSTQNSCGESNIRLNGQELNTEWDESHGLGSDFLLAFRFLPNIFVSWHISCIRDTTSSRDGNAEGVVPIQVARVGIYNHNEGRTEAAGFAVSFRSSAKPEILRLVPVWTEHSDVFAHPQFWGTPSMTALLQLSHPEHKSTVHEAEQEPDAEHKEKSLKAHIGHLQSFLGTTFQKARETFQSWCPTNKQGTPGVFSEDVPSAVYHDITTTPTTNSVSTNAHTLPTRSASPEPASTISISDPSHYTGLKIFGLVLILSSVIIWITLRLRDPRLRADRAARREERRNKRLYRQAARQQKWKRWFCSWRHRDHHCTPASTWDEKQARVLEHEKVLEEVMNEDIRKLTTAYRSRNNISAAEQGRGMYMYDSDSSGRPSRETLPGYESEGTQPPSYDRDVIGGVSRAADGFQYVPADQEDTPDSSVISTSPRTSRDDRSSIYEKDIEPLSLSTATEVV
ncbi:MAG: hypothetical protein Q9184_004338 [Pyrenodesmia sp. 2 TL-2023]